MVAMVHEPIPSEFRGWWRIIETSQWGNEELDILGPALISFTGYGDRLRMLALLAYVNCKPTKLGLSFTWKGAWEFDPVSGSGRARLSKDGRLKGVFKIKDGDQSAFVAERSVEPDSPIPLPPSYRDKWRRRWSVGRQIGVSSGVPIENEALLGQAFVSPPLPWLHLQRPSLPHPERDHPPTTSTGDHRH
jgi:hypothetical protein